MTIFRSNKDIPVKCIIDYFNNSIKGCSTFEFLNLRVSPLAITAQLKINNLELIIIEKNFSIKLFNSLNDLRTKKISSFKHSNAVVIDLFDALDISYVIMEKIALNPSLSLKERLIFNDWCNDGNVQKIRNNIYIEQSTQWKKLFTYDELVTYFLKNYINQNE